MIKVKPVTAYTESRTTVMSVGIFVRSFFIREFNRIAVTEGGFAYLFYAVFHFVFFAQVRPEKGIDTLAKAALVLNSEGLGGRFDIDVYGRVVDDYEAEFYRLVNCVPNMAYKGVIDSTSFNIYAVLNQYDVAVSSSSWQEGMSGSNVECKFAGIANIVSDAGFNSECVHDGADGLLVKPRDVESLTKAMRSVIECRELLERLKRGSWKSRVGYDVATWKQEVLDVVCE